MRWRGWFGLSFFRLHTRFYEWIFLLKLHSQTNKWTLSFIAVSRFSQYFPNLDRNIYCPSTDGNLKAIIIITKPWDLFTKLLHMSFTAQNTSLHFKLSFVLTHQWPKYNSFLFNLIQSPLNIGCPICKSLSIHVYGGYIAFFLCIAFFTACYCHLVFDCYHHKRYRLSHFVICSIISCFTTSLHNMPAHEI